ncbi:MAG: nitroreductase family protein [Planctomycetota bacterium]|nr:nitroreductase family protein [Planctomycetota bacterium]
MTVLEAIKLRRSVRAYSLRPIPDDLMQRMRDALRYAPSACNIQPWQFILVTDATLRRQLARAAKEQMWMADAPVTIVACGYPKLAYPRMGGRHSSLDIDIAIALDHLTLATVAEGLGTCWIGALFEEQVKAILDVPDDVRVVAMTPLGYPASGSLIHSVTEDQRKSEAEVSSVNRFQSR